MDGVERRGQHARTTCKQKTNVKTGLITKVTNIAVIVPTGRTNCREIRGENSAVVSFRVSADRHIIQELIRVLNSNKSSVFISVRR